MRRYRALLLLGVAAGLTAGLVWWDQRQPSTDETARARGKLAPGFDAGAADRLEIARGGASVRLRREADGWWIEAPRRRAAESTVDAILGALEFGQLERRMPGRADSSLRRKLGLEPPRVTLTAGRFVLGFGADAPGGRGVYVERGGEAELLVAEHRLVELVDVPPERFVSLRLGAGAPDELHALSVGAVSLERGAAGWRLVHPVKALAAAEPVERMLKALAEAKAARIVEEAPPAGGASLTVDGKPQARLLGPCAGAGETMVVRADGAALCFADAALAPLKVEASELREPKVFPLALDEVAAIDVMPVGTPAVSLRRAAGQWRILAPLDAAGVAEDAAVREWLAKVLAAHGHGFGAPARARATLRLATPGESVEAAISPTTALRRGDDDALAVAVDGTLAELTTGDLPARFRSRRLLSFRPAELRRVSVEEGGRSEDGAALVGALSDLHAEQFLDAKAEVRATRRILVELDGGERKVIELARDCSGKIAGAPPFRLASETCAALLGPAAPKGNK